jgi:hypothetical protein
LIASFVPSLALAQPEPPPPQAPPPTDQPAVVSNERPMRFVLSGGNVVVGTKIAEDAEFYTVQTATGPVRIRKTDVSFMDFNTQGGAAPVAPANPQPTYAPPPTYAPVPPPVAPYPVRPRRPGRGLFIAGVIIFSIFYGMSFLYGTIGSTEEMPDLWLLLPVAGPLIFYATGTPDRDSLGLLLVDSIAQAAGLIMWIAGKSQMDRAEEEQAAQNPFRIADGVDLFPAVTTRVQGLALRATF